MHYYGAVDLIEKKLKANQTWATLVAAARENGRLLEADREMLHAAVSREFDAISQSDFEQIWKECQSEYTFKSGKKPSEIDAQERMQVVINDITYDLMESIYEAKHRRRR
jgi:hypothetical protein